MITTVSRNAHNEIVLVCTTGSKDAQDTGNVTQRDGRLYCDCGSRQTACHHVIWAACWLTAWPPHPLPPMRP